MGKPRQVVLYERREGAKYREVRPLFQGRVSRARYEEARRRAASAGFSMSKWLDMWLEVTFAEHPPIDK